MAKSVKRVLFIHSEIFPFLPESPLSTIGRKLPQGIMERGREIRIFMPRYGCINERKNQLHEVIRLSGLNIIIGDLDRPLIIKVASVSSARMQVYFIDNEDYFKRRQLSFDEDGKFFEDNDQRAIFFARGVLETVKKLRWAPDIVHCQGWISHLVPLYLKKLYAGDPIFTDCKVVTTLYDEIAGESFAPSFASLAQSGGIQPADLDLLAQPDGITLAETAARYSDGIIFGSDTLAPRLTDYCKGLKVPVLPYDAAAMADGSYIAGYDAFYEQL